MKMTKIISKLIVFVVITIFASSFYSCKKDPQKVDNNVSPNDFLSSNKYTSLTIEIDYVSGYAPTDACIQNLVTLLQSRLNKPNGVKVTKKVISSGSNSIYSLTDVEAIEKSNRTQQTNGSSLTAYIVFLDKDYSENQSSSQSKVLGVTYQKSSIVIFENVIRQYCGGIGQPSAELLESTVVEHEFGHVMGLVNNGTSMVAGHQDSSHGAHCNNQNCLMYWSVETSDIVSNILGTGTIPDFDGNCLSDLQHNGGK